MGVSKRTRQREIKKNVLTVAIIALFAVAVFSINSIGKFIAEKIIQPVARLTASDGDSVVTDTVKTERLELFLVSAGACETLDEAQALAVTVNEKGGSGYIFELDGSFNVIFCVNTESDEAHSRAEELKAELSTSVMTLSLNGLSLKITGTDAQKQVISDCFKLLNDTALELIDTVKNADALTSLKISTGLRSTEVKIDELSKKLNELNSGNATVSALSDMLACTATLLSEMPSSGDAAYTERLKYTCAAYACEYYNFFSELE